MVGGINLSVNTGKSFLITGYYGGLGMWRKRGGDHVRLDLK